MYKKRIGKHHGRTGLQHTITQEARIANNELILETKLCFYHDKHSTQDELQVLTEMLQDCQRRPKFCPHLFDRTERGLPFSSADTTDLFRRAVMTADHTTIVDEGSCRYCELDYEIAIQPPQGTRGRLEVAMTGWQNLGAGRSIADPKWISCCDLAHYLLSRKPVVEIEHEPGSVCKAFRSVRSTRPSGAYRKYWLGYLEDLW